MVKNKLFVGRCDAFTYTKAADSETDSALLVEGYASTSSVDRANDVITPNAWRKGVDTYLTNPIMLAFHNHSNPVGKMEDYRIDDKGLWVKARISKAAGKIYDLIKDKVISAFSVGILVKDAEYDPDTDIFIIKDLELIEISVVSVGMNRDSLFDLSKSFKNADEYKEFKMGFAPYSAEELVDTPIEKDELEMTKEELDKLVADTAKSAVDSVLAAQAEAKAKADAEAQAEKAEADALNAKIQKAISDIQVGESGAEKLLAEVEKRFKEEAEKNASTIAELNEQLKEKSEEIQAIQKSRMQFDDKGGNEAVTYQEKETACILAALLKKDVKDTKYGKALLEKAGPHVASATWELEVSRNMESEVRRRLVVAPIFRSISMMTNVMTLPINPEAGVATWVQNSEFGTAASSGATQTHQLGEINLHAYKVSTREYVNHEEEEDALIPVIPVVRDAMVRRLARAIDIAFLRGAGAGADPVKGLTAYDAVSAVTKATSGAVTVADLRALRKDLNAWGLDPSELRYIVSTEVYYDLLDDTTFQTMEKVGTQATLLTGQIGSVGNTPVLVSAEFEAKAANKIGAIVVAPANFMVGNQRGLRMDVERQDTEQRILMVASMRTGLTQLTTNLGSGISAFQWTA